MTIIKIYVYDKSTGKPVEQVDKTDEMEANTFIDNKVKAGYRVDSTWEK